MASNTPAIFFNMSALLWLTAKMCSEKDSAQSF
jgi:hypothetical protein